MSTAGESLVIRSERPADAAPVRRVNTEAFGRPNEAELVAALRAAEAVTLALVAKEAGAVVGHIVFSPVTVEGAAGRGTAHALGPMAVLPERQRQGIGSRLVTEGLALLKERGGAAVVVLGHPVYYPRFGFLPGSRFGLRCEFECPDEVFMALELRPGALAGREGLVRYHPAFAGV